MIAFNNGPNEFPSRRLPTSSSGGAIPYLPMSQPHEEFGQVIHVLPVLVLQQLRPHPAATIFPCLDIDVDRMRESLKRSDQQQPITLYGIGNEIVLDGNCRIKAALQLGISLTAVWIDDEALGDRRG